MGCFNLDANIYQKAVMVGMREFEQWQKYKDEDDYLEILFSILRPEEYRDYKKKKDVQRVEEGVDEVVYSGEDNWSDIDEELKEFGFGNVDIYGKGLSG